MSRIRANKITNKVGTGAIELEKGAHLPVGMGITGAGSINLTGIITAATINATTFQGIDSTALKDPAGNVKVQAQASGAVHTGISTFQDIDVDGHTNLDNLSVAGVATVTGNLNVGGVLTYEDVTNIDSVGLVTAREGIFLPDNKELKIGNTAGSPDLKLYHNQAHSYIEDAGTGGVIVAASMIQFQNAAKNELILTADQNGSVSLFHDNSRKIETSNTGITVTGTVAATSYTGDGSQLTGIVSGITTEALVKTNGQTASLDLSKDDHKVTATGTVTIDVTGGSEADSHTLRIVNSGIATVGFSTYFIFPSGGTPSLPTTSGAISLISFTVHRAGAVGVSTQLLSGASVDFS